MIFLLCRPGQSNSDAVYKSHGFYWLFDRHDDEDYSNGESPPSYSPPHLCSVNPPSLTVSPTLCTTNGALHQLGSFRSIWTVVLCSLRTRSPSTDRLRNRPLLSIPFMMSHTRSLILRSRLIRQTIPSQSAVGCDPG
jgi:hypothetical protein